MKLRILTFLAMALVVALVAACGCGDGSVCGSGNIVAPSTTVTSTVTQPTPQASPSATPGCVAQTAAFVCETGGRLFEAILLDAQRSVPASPEPIYILALVAELNKRADVCAIAGPSPDEVTIKARSSNSISATWDVVRADGAVQAIVAPKNLCVPARF